MAVVFFPESAGMPHFISEWQARNPDWRRLVPGVIVCPVCGLTVRAMADYALVNILDELKRVPGVGDMFIFGAGSSMRVWLNPERMARLGVTASDVANAIRAQNTQYAAGKVGAEPAPPGQAVTFTVTVRGRLVRGLWNGPRPAGPQALAWDGRDDSGGALPSGVYLVRIAARGFTASQPVTLVK